MTPTFDRPQAVLVYSDDADFYANALRAEFPQLELQATSSREQALAWLPGRDTLVTSGARVDEAMLAAGRQLRWVHALTSGTDALTASATLSADVIITSSRGVHGPQMAELALMLMMSLNRRLPHMLANQAAGIWERWPQPLLFGKHLVVVGVGTVGEALALRSRAMGMRVSGVASVHRPAPGFDMVYARDGLEAVLADADFVVVLLPHDASTHHLIGARALAAMPQRAFLLNLGRGSVVDEAALLAALEQGRIAGAALDVFATEPLPSAHPFWRMPNVIVTPHIGGQSDIYAQQTLPLLLDNMRVMLAGNPAALTNRVQ